MTAIATPPRPPTPRRSNPCSPESCGRRSGSSKLDPRVQIRNPVMFVVEIGALITTIAWIVGDSGDPRWFTFTIAVWLWLTVVFANLAEALAEGRGRAQAASLRAMRAETDGAARRRRRARGVRARSAATSWSSRPAR